MDISVKIGEKIELKNPLMPASGPLVGDFKKIKYICDQGTGAAVTKTISSQAASVPRPCIIGGSNYIINTELWSEYPPEKWCEEFLPSVSELDVPVFISLGYTEEQIIPLIRKTEKYADAFEISTHYLGKDLVKIGESLDAITSSTKKPVFVKMSPHVSSPEEFANMAKINGAYGIVAINSLGPVYPLSHESSKSPLGSNNGFGWISGPVIKNLALAIIRNICKNVDIPVIGVGGISSASDVIEFIEAGASAVQMLSAAMIKGKTLYSRIIRELPEYMDKKGINSLREIKGSALKTNNTPVYDCNHPRIDMEKCSKCMICVNNCPYFALEFEKGKITLDEDECFGCGLCESRCPTGAISGVLL